MARARWVIHIFVAVAVVFSAGAGVQTQAFAQPADDKQVVAGERIGNVRLSSRLADVEGSFGRGVAQGRGLWEGSTYYDFPSAALAVIADNTTGNLLWVSVCACGTNPWSDHATPEGLKLNATEEQVVAAMGAPSRTFADANGKSLYYAAKGINFTVGASGDAAGRVFAYRIYWPNRSPGDTMIVPGRRISSITAGMAAQAAMATLGAGFIAVRQGLIELFHWPHFALRIFVEAGRVAQVSVFYEPFHEDIGVRYANAQGLGIGSTREEVRAAFGEPPQRELRGLIEAWVYMNQGIVFNVAISGSLTGRIVGVGVFAPR